MKTISKKTGVLVFATVMILLTVSVITGGTEEDYGLRLSSDEQPSKIGVGYNPSPRNMEKIISSSAVSDVILRSENFDETWVDDPDPEDPYMVPVGWDIDGICTGTQSGVPWATHYWRQFGDGAYPFTHSPPHCAGIWWSDGSYPDPPNCAQDEWLISPELDVSEFRHMELTFYSVYTMLRWGAGETAHDYIKVSTDGGHTWTVVADLAHDREFDFDGCSGGPGGYGWNWNDIPIVVDLSDYAGSDLLMIAFHYEIEGNVDRGVWMVDDVQLVAIFTPKLEVGGITGGLFRINAAVTNVGDANATDVAWGISVKGGIRDRINISTEGIIPALNISDTSYIKTKRPIVGLGKITITISASATDADTVTRTATGFVLFFYITNIIVQS